MSALFLNSGVLVFQVRGTCELDTRAQQVEEVAGSLNSDDVFVLETPSKTYLWIGKVRKHQYLFYFTFICNGFLKENAWH